MTVTLPDQRSRFLAGYGWIPGPPRRNTGMRSMMKFAAP